MKRVIEYEVCSVDTHSKEDLQILESTFKAIEKYFHTIDFIVQHYGDSNMLQSEDTVRYSQNILNRVIVDLDTAIDEFIIELSDLVTVQVFDGKPVMRNIRNIEVVREGIAEDNDMDFLGLQYNELLTNGEYQLGKVNSYYSFLGNVDGINFYYREL